MFVLSVDIYAKVYAAVQYSIETGLRLCLHIGGMKSHLEMRYKTFTCEFHPEMKLW